LIGGFDLAEDFRFTEHHAVESADDAEEMSRGFIGIKLVGDECFSLLRCEFKALHEIVHQFIMRGVGFVMRVGGVDLDTVAGTEHDAFLKAWQAADLLHSLGHFCLGERHALTDLYGRGAVVQAQADQLILGGL
jgi:hypothetical protein